MKIRLHPRRHCGGFLGIGESSSEQTTIAQQVAASEGSLAVGAGGKFVETGGIDIAGSSGAKLGSTELSAAGDVTITDTSGDVLLKALDKYAELSAGFGSSLNAFVSQASEDQSRKVGELLSAAEKAKESESTTAQNRKVFIGLAVGFFVFVLAWLWTRKG